MNVNIDLMFELFPTILVASLFVAISAWMEKPSDRFFYLSFACVLTVLTVYYTTLEQYPDFLMGKFIFWCFIIIGICSLLLGLYCRKRYE